MSKIIINNVLDWVKSDCEMSKEARNLGDKNAADYNEGVARGRLSTLYKLGAINREDLQYWTTYVDNHIS